MSKNNVDAGNPTDNESGADNNPQIKISSFIPLVISCLLLGAHYMRAGSPGLVLMWLFAPMLLFVRKRWVSVVFGVMLLWGGLVWVGTALVNMGERFDQGRDWMRMALILGVVGLFTAASALAFRTKGFKARNADFKEGWIPGASVFFLTFLALGIVQLKPDTPFILFERFLPGGGWLSIFWLSVYGAWVSGKILDPDVSARWRLLTWSFFSIVFFLQFAIGIFGVESFLMTGDLHLPVPALIVAGPIFRGERFFMPILFCATLVLAGPAWCSYLCYIGSWDLASSRLEKKPGPLPYWRRHMRMAILAVTILSAWIMREAGVPGVNAAWIAGGFGLIGVGVTVFWSRRAGVMVHCTSYCPIGFLAVTFGKINPFRIRINEDCNDCGGCSRACRYDALSADDIKRRRPGGSCTLCGDCVGKCKPGSIDYRFPGLDPSQARTLFVVLVVVLHAVFLGVARM